MNLSTQKLTLCFLLLVSLFGSSQRAAAQSVKEDFARDRNLSASNYVAYPTPPKAKETPAPRGYQAFYLSHYGRHGSRYLIDKNDYLTTIATLATADSASKLTATGKDLLRRLRMMEAESRNRYGELTELGARQHRDIARRMFNRYPAVFADSATIDAKSTVVIRCILSMENELLELTKLNPRLRIRHDASWHDMYFMNLTDSLLRAKRMPPAVQQQVDAWKKQHIKPRRMMQLLFNDTAYVAQKVDAEKLFLTLFKVASILQNSELRRQFTLYDIFTDDEIYTCWQRNNIWWYINYGPCPLNGATQPFSQRNLLRNIIEQADSCLRLSAPGATLRFGHETMVLPLVCLLGIDGHDKQIAALDSLEQQGWVNYRIFPMAANVQIIFYRRGNSTRDILLKVLLNEREATLPLPDKQAPYYRWSDFKAYYTKKLDDYR